MNGPWDTEPDRDDWEYRGLPCALRRNCSGAWCGYVGIPPTHPLHGLDYSAESEALAAALEKRKGQPVGETPSFAVMLACLSGKVEARPDIVFSVHGGITWAAAMPGGKGSEPGEFWWFGFDCSHAGDLSPKYDWHDSDSVYRTHGYAKSETESLADQLLEVGGVS